MEALLARVTRKNPDGLGSVEQLVDQLRSLLAEKTKPKRIEHISMTFELGLDVVFHIPVADSDGTENIEPTLSGLPPPASISEEGQTTRTIQARNAVLNQPQDNPGIQQLIARHLIRAVEKADGCQWLTRSVSRGAQGWTLTYICKDSYQSWKRQVTKNPPKLAVGAWSNKDGQDPVNMGRPAFDCGGSVEIAFSRNSRSINVTYKHSMLHKSVAQLMEILAPAPVPSEPTVPGSVREPKAQKATREPKTPGSARKKRLADGQGDHPSSEKARPRKRQKKSNVQIASEAEVSTTAAAVNEPPEGESSETHAHSTQVSGATHGNQNGYATESASIEADASAGVHLHTLPNLPPGESERRRDAAMKLLTDASLDPKTLSDDQFSIFANQSPDLQLESLALLVKYGAERLRIVHPTNNQSTTPPPAQQVTTVAGPDSPASVSPKRRKKAGKSKDNMVNPGSTTASPKPRGVFCQACREKKAKCDKVRPSCFACQASGTPCFYPPPKKRAPRKTAENKTQNETQPAPEAAVEVVYIESDGIPSPSLLSDEPSAAVQNSGGYPPPEPTLTSYNHGPNAYSSTTSQNFVETGASNPELTQTMGFGPDSTEHSSTEASYPMLDQLSAGVPQLATPPVLVQAETSTGLSRSGSRLSVPQTQKAAGGPLTADNQAEASAWQPQAHAHSPDNHPVAKRMPARATPKPSGPKGAALADQAHDNLPRAKSLTKGRVNGAFSSVPSQPSRHYQTAAAPAQPMDSASSRQSYRAQNRTPIPGPPSARPQEAASWSVNMPPGYYTGQQRQYSETRQSEPSSDRIPYEPYSSHNQPSNSSHYDYSYYNSQTQEGEPKNASFDQTQTMASSYKLPTSKAGSRWTTGPVIQPHAQSQSHDARSHTHRAGQGTAVPPHSSSVSPTLQHDSQAMRVPDLRQQVQNSHAQNPRAPNSGEPWGQQPEQNQYHYPNQPRVVTSQAHVHQSASTSNQQQQRRQQQEWYGTWGRP